MSRQVRAASTADRDAILDICVASFVTEPAFAHFFGDAYGSHARDFLAFLLDLRLAGGLVWLEESDGRVMSASLWDQPGGSSLPKSTQEALWDAAAETLPPDAVSRLDSYDERVAGSAPDGRYYYLGVLASDPSARGRGHGAAAMRPGLEAADAEGLPSYLETGTEGNLSFYQRYGFAVTTELDLDDGTRIWCLTRPAGRSLG